MDFSTLIPFVLYFCIIIGIGIYSNRFSSKGVSEFFVGGRQMHRFVVALSAVVSGRSAWLLLGFTGLAYKIGLPAIWAAVGYTAIELLLFLFYAPRIRRFAETHDCITIPDFYAARFNDRFGLLRTLIIIIFLIFMVTYVSAQLVAGGKAFLAHFGINPVTGLLITAAIVLLYTVLGGFLAVSLTDVLQAIFMLIALIALPVIAIVEKGGWYNAMNPVLDANPDFFNIKALSIGAFIGFLGIGLGSPGSPHIIVRYMSIKRASQLRWTGIVGTIWNILLAGGALFIGLLGRAYFPQVALLPGADPESVFISLANVVLHPVLVGLILAAVFAAIMSTADSQLLVAASSIVRDFYEKILFQNQSVPQKQLTLLSRISILVLVLIAALLGIWVKDLVFWFVLFAWAGLGASIGSTSILALFWKKTTKIGVAAGLISGTITVFIWKISDLLSGWIYELIPAFIIATLFTIIGSLIENSITNKY